MSGQAAPGPGAGPDAPPFTRTLSPPCPEPALVRCPHERAGDTGPRRETRGPTFHPNPASPGRGRRARPHRARSFAIAAEALIRGHLKTPEERIPTALYTRPVPWGGHGEGRRTAPIAIGTLDGSAAEERIPVRLTDLPDHLTQAVLAIEDRRYYQHHGLDFLRILGALVADVRAGAITQGGSTITQQVAKNVFLSAGRTPLRKLREVAFALVLEGRYDKATILEAYLNEIYLGQDGRRAIHGVGAAARYYFGKEARKLNLAESALLAGMISAPNRNAPTRNTELARGRRNLVLQLMADQRRISARAAESASRARIPTRAWPARAAGPRSE